MDKKTVLFDYAKSLPFVCIPATKQCSKIHAVSWAKVKTTNKTYSQNWRCKTSFLIITGSISNVIILDIDEPNKDEINGIKFLDALKKNRLE